MSGNLLHTDKSWSQKRMTEVSPDEYIRHPSLAAGGSPEQFREDPLCLPSKPLLLSPQTLRPHCSPWTAGEPFGEVLGHWPLPFFFGVTTIDYFGEIFLCTVITCASLRMQKFWHCLQHSWEAKATSRKFHFERFWARGSGLRGGGPSCARKYTVGRTFTDVWFRSDISTPKFFPWSYSTFSLVLLRRVPFCTIFGLTWIWNKILS